VAVDQELNREVAFKEIRDQLADDAFHRDRFLLEAEVTGGLEHPGIVPVYGLGSDPSVRPHYAMRFIRGESLREAIRRFHGGPGPGPGGAALRRFDSVEFRDLLGRFLDVCDAIAYAHARGVLHRDLKPANIMLGKYGETLVVDWGLARVGEAGGPAEAGEAPLSPSAGGSSGTVAGQAIGTPAYMSPEQAEGRLDALGPASDVYSLGATLYPLLAGRDAFAPGDGLSARVVAGDFPAPRRVRPGVPRALEAICLKAMARRPEDRYPTARALSEDLKRWLADEPVSAYREPVSARAARWGRRHKTALAVASALLVTSLVATAIAYRREAAHASELSAANATIRDRNAGLEQANEALGLARAEAESERDRSEAVKDFLVESFRSPDPAFDGRAITVAEVLGRASAGLAERGDLDPAAKWAILNAIGMSYHGLGLPAEAMEVFERARDASPAPAGPGRAEALSTRNNLALAYASAGRLREAIELYEKTLAAWRSGFGPGHPGTLATRNNLGMAYATVGRLEEAIEQY
jgi:tetratricopeptide (TPR) repeat protein/tRNA A-37 threonylcarbamoyl transferase component Bud32